MGISQKRETYWYSKSVTSREAEGFILKISESDNILRVKLKGSNVSQEKELFLWTSDVVRLLGIHTYCMWHLFQSQLGDYTPMLGTNFQQVDKKVEFSKKGNLKQEIKTPTAFTIAKADRKLGRVEAIYNCIAVLTH